MRRKTPDQTGYFWIRRCNTVPGEGRTSSQIRRMISAALQSQAGLSDLDHGLTTDTPSINVDKGGQTRAKVIVFVDLFECYLRSGRRGRRPQLVTSRRVSVIEQLEIPQLGREPENSREWFGRHSSAQGEHSVSRSFLCRHGRVAV